MKQLVLLFSFWTLLFTAQGQLTKGIWLVGGTGGFSSTKNTYSSSAATQTSDVVNLKLSPNIGYFLLDKFAVGLRPSFAKTKAQVTTVSGLSTNENRLDFGPFARYYFLDAEKQFNILADATYQYGFYWFTPTKGNRNTFSASGGTVVFFNSSVGLELLIGYYWRKEKINDAFKTTNEEKGLQMTIGFQFYLEK